MFIMIDGIDGAGKSTIIQYWKNECNKKGLSVFNLRDYCTTNHTLPLPDELASFDVILSAEPTTAWIGNAIRQEMIKTGTHYSATSIANAYALDRLILYNRLILPLLAQNKIILQDRGVSTSLCYQSLQTDTFTMDHIAAIEGNAFALTHAPQYLVIADIEPHIAISRLHDRTQKQDNVIFEQEAFLTKARNRFISPEFQAYFTQNGSQIRILNSGTDHDTLQQNAVALLDTLLA